MTCHQQCKTSSSVQQEPTAGASEASSNKRNQYTRRASISHCDDLDWRRTPGRSWTHLLVPCCLSPSCSCIQTPRPDLSRLGIHSSFVVLPKKHDFQSQRMSFLSTPEGRVDQSSVKQNTLYTALHPQLCSPVLRSCGKIPVFSALLFSVSCFLCEGSAGARGERSWCVCSVISDVQCVWERERWRGGEGLHVCVSMREWPTSLRSRSWMLEERRWCLSRLCLAASRVPLGMSDVLIQWPVSCSCVYMITEPLEPAASQHSGFIFTPNLMQNIKAIFRSFSHSVTFKHIFQVLIPLMCTVFLV